METTNETPVTVGTVTMNPICNTEIPATSVALPKPQEIVSRAGNVVGKRFEFGSGSLKSLKDSLKAMYPKESNTAISKRANALLKDEKELRRSMAHVFVDQMVAKDKMPELGEDRESGIGALKFRKFKTYEKKESLKDKVARLEAELAKAKADSKPANASEETLDI